MRRVLRPRLIVQATTFVWVCFMGLALYGSAIWTSYENFAVASNRDRGNGVKPGLDVEGIGTLTSTSGGQEPPSLPGNPVRPTSRNPFAKMGTPGHAQYRLMPCTAVLPESRVVGSWECAPSDGSAHGVRHASGSGKRLLESRAGALSGGELRTGAPGSYAGWASESGRRGSIPHPLVHLQTLATNAANLCGVPPALFHSLIERESSWRPYVVSSSGAVGLAQVKPSTARDVSPGLDVHDPWQNLVAGSCYLRQQYDRFGTWRKALKAYHAGPNRTRTKQATHDYADDVIGGSAQ